MVDTDDDDYYFILVNNYINGHQGFDFVLSITEDPQPPDNNALVASQPVYEGDMVEGTTAGATLEYGLVGMTCGLKITAPGVWYDFMGTGTQVEFSLYDDTGLYAADFDARISIFCGTGPSLGLCIGGSLNTARVTIDTCAGTPYKILVHGKDDQVGNFRLRVTDVVRVSCLCCSHRAP